MEMVFAPGSWFGLPASGGCQICAAAGRALDDQASRLTAELARNLLSTGQFHGVIQCAAATLSGALTPSRASAVVPEPGGQWRVFVSSDIESSQDLVIAAERYPELLEIRRTGLPFLAQDVADAPALADQLHALNAAGVRGMAAFPIWYPPGAADPLILKVAVRRRMDASDLALAVVVAHLLVHRLSGLAPDELSRRLSTACSPSFPPEGVRLSLQQLPLGAVLVNEQGQVTTANSRAKWLIRALGGSPVEPPSLALQPSRPWDRGASRWEATLRTTPEPTHLIGWSSQLPEGHVLVFLESDPEVKRRDRERQIQQTLALKVRELAEANRRLEEYASLRSRFVSDAAHELKTPLAILRSYLDTLETDLSTGLNPEQREFLRAATVGAQRLQTLVEALLDLAAMEAGHAAFRLEAVPVRDLLHTVTRELIPSARRKEVILEVASSDDVTLRADLDRLLQVVRNLVDNGIKYSRNGGRVTLSCREAGERGLIVVEDAGIGVPADVLPHIFEEFVRGAGQEKAPGAGLGLAIVRRLVQAMGGRVWAESKEYQGSRFSVELPIWTGTR